MPQYAVIETEKGTIKFVLYTEEAPITTSNFIELANRNFYEGLKFHRVEPGFVIQGGDPLGDGTGGPGYSVDEAPPSNLAYTKGVVAMAKTAVEPASLRPCPRRN